MHLLLHYLRTQAGVALSSAEAELNATLKMGCGILGISQFCRELEDNVDIKINGDSSAVKGILARRGCGKVKHLKLKQLWLQEQVRSGKVEIHKISWCMNPTNPLTHHYTQEDAKKHFKHMSIESMPTSSELRGVQKFSVLFDAATPQTPLRKNPHATWRQHSSMTPK